MRFEKIPLNRIAQLTSLVRLYRGGEWLNFMAEDIRKHGVQTPIHAVRVGDRFSPVDGWHRVEAARRVGLSEIPAFVYEEGEVDPFILSLRLNMLQKSLDPISIASAIHELVYKRRLEWKQVEEITGLSDTHCQRLLRLLNLPDDVKEEIAAGIKPPFAGEVQIELRPHNVEGARRKPGSRVQCLICGRFPEKGRGRWIYFCEDHKIWASRVRLKKVGEEVEGIGLSPKSEDEQGKPLSEYL
jgi:ParB/RepB/Spo0J family partition protein